MLTPKEARVDDLVKACLEIKFILFIEKTDLVSYIYDINRMRNIHTVIETEFGRESVTIFRRWEQHEKNLTNFKNHRRFTLRRLSQKITPVSLRLKSSIKTERGIKIIQRAEKQLMDERVR